MSMIPQIRKIIFWDTDFENIDWDKSKDSVVKRVLQYGNNAEKEEIIKFYKLTQEDIEKYQREINKRFLKN